MQSEGRIIVCLHNDVLHVVPLKCQGAMKWLLDACDAANIQIDNIYFMMDPPQDGDGCVVQCEDVGPIPILAGEFVRAQGVLRRGDKALAIEIFADCHSNIAIDVNAADYEEDCRVWSEADGGFHSLGHLFDLMQ